MLMSHVAERRPTAPRSRLPRRVGVLVAAVIVLALLAAIVLGGKALLGSFGMQDYSGTGKGEVLVEVQARETASDIGRTLEQKGVVKSSAAFVKAAKKDDRSRSIQPGSYTLRTSMSGASALSLLLDPASKAFSSVVIPEGLSQNEVLDRIAAGSKLPLADLKAAAANPAALGVPDWAAGHLEGLLFPATYEIQPDDSATAVLTMMVDRFEQEAATLDLPARAGALGRTPYEIVVVASLAEREARKDDEYAKVARVIYNRLAQKKKLEIDATVLYGLGRTKGGLTAADLAKPTPYNTRTNVVGLPPTPIASPGRKALEAALSPEEGDWIFYVVSAKDGTQFYTADYNAFLNQKNKSLAEGLF
ncbi:MAG: putative periplasmic solute-binding protein [Frankiales bacterium]|nr:putative periplasmic solute-binding protein [Frankiales bacterium]